MCFGYSSWALRATIVFRIGSSSCNIDHFELIAIVHAMDAYNLIHSCILLRMVREYLKACNQTCLHQGWILSMVSLKNFSEWSFFDEVSICEVTYEICSRHSENSELTMWAVFLQLSSRVRGAFSNPKARAPPFPISVWTSLISIKSGIGKQNYTRSKHIVDQLTQDGCTK